MKIRSTIISSYLAIGLVTFSISVSTLLVLSRINLSSQHTKDVMIQSFDESHAILYHLQDIAIYLLSQGSPNAVNIMPALSPSQLMTEIDRHFTAFRNHLNLDEGDDSTETQSELLAPLQSARTKWHSFSNRYQSFLEALPQTPEEEIIQTINSSLLPDLKEIVVALHAYQRLSMSLSASHQQDIHQSVSQSSRWITVLGMVQLCLAMVGCWLACYLILKPLQSLVHTMERIQTGKTTVRFTYAGNNEIGYLARTFNEMVKRWHETLTAQSKAEHTLVKREKLFEDLFEFSPDVMMMIDPTGTIQKINRHGEIIFEWPRKDLIGKHFEVLLALSHQNPKTITENDPLNQVFMDYMGVSGFKMKALTRSGKQFDAEMNFKTLDTESGPMIAVVIRDISKNIGE